MEPITLITAGLICATIGAQLATKPLVKSDSYSLTQLQEVAQAIDPNACVSGIERLIPVSTNENESATLYDLNGDEGFFVLGNDYKIFDFQPNVALNSNLSGEELVFNPINRTFSTSNNERVSITDELSKPAQPVSNGNDDIFEDHGCGRIEEKWLERYLEEKFPNGELEEEYSLPITRRSQIDLSVYVKEWTDEEGTKWIQGEGNCWLCATYTVFDYLVNDSSYRNYAFRKFPKRSLKTVYYPQSQEPSTYNWVTENRDDYDARGKIGGTLEPKTFDNLYISFRQRGIDLKTDSPMTGLSTDNNVTLINDVAHVYGLNNFKAEKDIFYNSYVGSEDFKNFIKADKPLIFISNGGTYGNHVMAVSGYKHYKRTVKVLFWDKIEWATFLQIGDGWTTDVTYFDITRFYWEGCGNAEFIKYTW